MLWSRVVGGAMDGGGIGRYLAVKNMGSRVIHETTPARRRAKSARGRVLIIIKKDRSTNDDDKSLLPLLSHLREESIVIARR